MAITLNFFLADHGQSSGGSGNNPIQMQTSKSKAPALLALCDQVSCVAPKPKPSMAPELKRHAYSDEDSHDKSKPMLVRERSRSAVSLPKPRWHPPGNWSAPGNWDDPPRRSLLDASVEGSKQKAAAPLPPRDAWLSVSTGSGAGMSSSTPFAVPAAPPPAPPSSTWAKNRSSGRAFGEYRTFDLPVTHQQGFVYKSWDIEAIKIPANILTENLHVMQRLFHFRQIPWIPESEMQFFASVIGSCKLLDVEFVCTVKFDFWRFKVGHFDVTSLQRGEVLYHWAHGTTPQGLKSIISSGRVEADARHESGFYCRATDSEDGIPSMLDKCAASSKFCCPVMVEGVAVTPRSHATVRAGGTQQGQRDVDHSGVVHCIGDSIWIVHEDLQRILHYTVAVMKVKARVVDPTTGRPKFQR